MKITRDNYEVYFIDYFDGNLSVEIENSLHLFLNDNLDLKDEFNEFNNFNLADISSEKKEVKENDFNVLKKDFMIDSSNEDEYYIAYLEGDLSSQEKENINLYIADNQTKIDKLDSFKKTKLEVPFIPFPNKKALKKKEKKPIFFYVSLLAAACFLGFVLLQNYNNLSPNEIDENPILVDNNSSEKNPTILNIDTIKGTFEKEKINSLPVIIKKEIANKRKFIAKINKGRVIQKKDKPENNIPEIEREERISFEKMTPREETFAMITPTNELNNIGISIGNTDIISPVITETKSYSLLGYVKHKATAYFEAKTGLDISTNESFKAMIEDSKNTLDDNTGYKKKQESILNIFNNRKIVLYSKKK